MKLIHLRNLAVFMKLLVILSFLPILLFSSGCGSDCKKLKEECDQSIEKQAQLANGIAKELHFGVTMRDTFIEEIARKSLQSVLEKGLDIQTKLPISKAQNVSIVARPKIKNLKIRPDKACDHCIRISGNLTGKAAIKVPILGSQNVPLAGNIAIVAPLIFSAQKNGKTAIKIDLQKAVKYNPNFLSLSLKQIPPTWSRVIAGSFSKSAIKAVSAQLKPMTIFTFDAPNFGIENLKVAPRSLKTDFKNRTIFVGFSTNLSPSKSGKGMAARTRLASGTKIGIGLDPRILASSASVLMHSGKISNTYTEKGKSDPKGPISITMDRFEVGVGKNNSLPAKIAFRYWQIPQDGTCLWADIESSAILSIQKGSLSLKMKDFEIKKSSLPEIVVDFATWTQSGFSANQERVVTAPLENLSLSIPGGKKVLFSAQNVSFDAGGIWLEANTRLK